MVDYARSTSYPSNFVCMLPAKVEVVKGKSTSAFGGLWRKLCTLAIELLSKALRTEKEAEVKTEIERRLKHLDSKQTGRVECSECKKNLLTDQNEKVQAAFLSRLLSKEIRSAILSPDRIQNKPMACLLPSFPCKGLSR